MLLTSEVTHFSMLRAVNQDDFNWLKQNNMSLNWLNLITQIKKITIQNYAITKLEQKNLMSLYLALSPVDKL